MNNESDSRKNQLRGLKRFGKEKPAIPGPGRPRLTEEEKNERELLKASSPKAARLLERVLDSKDERNAVRAAEIILSKTVPELSEGVIHGEHPLPGFTDEQLVRKLAELEGHSSHSNGNGVAA